MTGVDINSQPRYCGDAFFQGDALEFPLDGYDFIWASPPCQAYSIASLNYRKMVKVYPDLVELTRERLNRTSCDWVMENVIGAPLRPDIILCGSQFGLEIARHRIFECSFPAFQLRPSCAHVKDVVSVVGHGAPSWSRSKKVRGERYWKSHTMADCRRAMGGVDWMTRKELVESVPPAYSEFIAKQFLAQRVLSIA